MIDPFTAGRRQPLALSGAFDIPAGGVKPTGAPYRSPYHHIYIELERLSKLIDSETDEAKKTNHCAAYQTLNWVVAQDGFAAPSRADVPV